MMQLKEGRYYNEQPCWYCDREENPSKMTIVVDVAPPGQDCPVTITGKCDSNRDEFHRVEHAMILPLKGYLTVVLHDEFCGLYCTSYYSLARYSEWILSLSDVDTTLDLFYSSVSLP